MRASDYRCFQCEFIGQVNHYAEYWHVCRRNPPISNNGWPRVNPDNDWCGEFSVCDVREQKSTQVTLTPED